LSTVRHADRIALLEDGQLVALGDHGTLLQTCAPYRTLAQQQGYAP